MSLQVMHRAWLARLPKGTRIRAKFELTNGEQRASFELVCANECMISIGSEGEKRGFIRADLLAALDALVTGAEGDYGDWKLDPASVTVEQAPKSATRAQVAALLTPILSAVF